MSDRKPLDAADGAADESFLGRWSRLKAQARESESAPGVGTDPSSQEPPDSAVNEVMPAEAPALHPGGSLSSEGAAPSLNDPLSGEAAKPIHLPDLDQLDQDSDYSAFLTPGVDADLRKRALRKLFHSPKFNVFDGLDTYRDDFRSFPPLGDVVTADMRYELERAAKLLARADDAVSRSADPAQPPPALAQQPAVQPPTVPREPAPQSRAPAGQREPTPEVLAPAPAHEPTADPRADTGPTGSPKDDHAERDPA
jgi:hypothetical protein